MGGGVVLAATREAVAMIRHSTLFLMTLVDGKPVLQCTQELLQNLPTDESESAAADGNDQDDEAVATNTQHPVKQGITAAAFFQQDATANSDVYTLLLLVDERKLVHYEANVAARSVELRGQRTVPRNSTCMTVSRLQVNGETKHVVIVGEKTGEAVAMPFPDLKRDLKTLLGHTTSMITYMALTHDASLLLTADRDEKIRVSHFPRTPLVQSYCLGHKAALTRVVCSVATPELAVTTSLDNTIKLWNVTTGALLASQPLLTSIEDQDALNAALMNVSLAVCPVKNVVCVALNNRELQFFAIEQGAEVDAFQLTPKALSPQIQTYVSAHEPTEAAFTAQGVLSVAYRQSPFLRLFNVSKITESHIALSECSAQEDFARLRKTAAAIELPKESDKNAEDDTDGGLKKKKVRTNDWKAKLPGVAN